jgi:hypothetical protein
MLFLTIFMQAFRMCQGCEEWHGFAFTGFAFWSRLGNWATARSEQQPLVREALVRLARVTPRSR